MNDFQEVVKGWMDEGLNRIEGDLTLSNVFGGMALVRELRCLNIMKEVSDTKGNPVN